MPELVFFRRGEEVMRFTLDANRVVLGRGERCDVQLPDPEVSRMQVALVLVDGACHFEDLSGRGTVVAGTRASTGSIPDGGDIALGQWRAIYRRSGSSNTDGLTEAGARTEIAERGDDQPAQAAQLRVRVGGAETVHRLQVDTFTIGKDPSNDLALDQRFISSRHLKVTRAGNRFHLVDQHSTNGTWLGTVRLFEADLPFFAPFKVGDTELTLEPAGSALPGKSPGPASGYQGMVGNDPAVRALTELVERVAPSQAAVAIFGESGTGKELVARAVHTRSNRTSGPFVPVNCAAISKELIESELFGHEKGSFTGATGARKGAFEEADGGTLFLDEIGELPLDLQAKLLRALESGEIKRVGASRPITVDVRIVAATNRDLLREAKAGNFREDLYYRLCVIPLTLPPLRSRASDIAALADHFVKMFAPKGHAMKLSPTALAKLQSHTWPGNIRELRNVIHRALLLRRGPHLEDADISFDGARPDLVKASAPAVDLSSGTEFMPGLTLEQQLARHERNIIEASLRRLNGNREKVAKELGVARSTLFKRLKEWGLTNQDDAE
jgi:two-component system, NtrC family, response regulator HydG